MENENRVYWICYPARDRVEALHGELARAREELLADPKKKLDVKSGPEFQGFPGSLTGKLRQNKFQWKKQVNVNGQQVLLEEALPRKDGWTVVTRDPNGVIISRNLFDKKHAWLRADYFEPWNAGRAKTVFSPGPEGRLIRQDWEEDKKNYAQTELYPVPYRSGTAEQSLVDAQLGAPQLLALTSGGERCFCGKSEAEARQKLMADVSSGTVVLMPAWEIKGGELVSGSPETNLELAATPERMESEARALERDPGVSFPSLTERASVSSPPHVLTGEAPPPPEHPLPTGEDFAPELENLDLEAIGDLEAFIDAPVTPEERRQAAASAPQAAVRPLEPLPEPNAQSEPPLMVQTGKFDFAEGAVMAPPVQARHYDAPPAKHYEEAVSVPAAPQAAPEAARHFQAEQPPAQPFARHYEPARSAPAPAPAPVEPPVKTSPPAQAPVSEPPAPNPPVPKPPASTPPKPAPPLTPPESQDGGLEAILAEAAVAQAPTHPQPSPETAEGIALPSGYTGDIKDGQITGRGRTEQRGGLTSYEGDYVDGKRHGFGAYYYKDGNLCYAGSWKDDRRDGLGVSFRDSDHALHVANWHDGQPQGLVTLFDGEGNLRFSGRMENGKKEGAGVVINGKDGTVFVGQYAQGEATGLGSAFDREGRLVYYGSWKNGKRHGHGTEFDLNGGIVFDGEFRDGKYYNGVLYQKY